MTPLLPGQAAVTRIDGRVCLVLCDDKEHLPLGAAAYDVGGAFQQVVIAGVVVHVVIVLVRLKVEGQEGRYYAAWVDELSEGVLESLTTQPELPVILANPLVESVGTAIIPNGLRDLAHRSLGTISALTDKARWEPRHFAAARTFIEFKHQEPATLWTVLGGK